jgi:hypothetical protein
LKEEGLLLLGACEWKTEEELKYNVLGVEYPHLEVKAEESEKTRRLHKIRRESMVEQYSSNNVIG